MTESEMIISKFKEKIERYRKEMHEGKEMHPEETVRSLLTEVEAMDSVKNAIKEGAELIIADMKKLGKGK
ncbi:hypothetical protein [Bacillus safensis]|uniref:hypothetical protein n=1 Tax=Bacillus safensis TaxID=561879 RepID=UPI00090C29C8|nr:hypothetical protein [Bacillus safensis]APJ11099.1 hypothetical protein BSL056_09070 [Bacillus safensis]